jgi:beta-lactamase class D
MQKGLGKLISLFFVSIVSFGCAFTSPNLSNNITLIIKDLDSHQILFQTGDITYRASPCSTFKIALSLMGYDSGILLDEASPFWPYNPKYDAKIDLWKNSHNPLLWIKNYCIWFSREITAKLGIESFKKYVNIFEYGNEDISGDAGINNGLTNCWLSSSLKISPLEQISFLEKLVEEKLPVSSHAHKMTKAILFVEKLANGWELFGKRGSGYLPLDESEEGCQIGWFVGWGKINDRTLLFALLIKDEKQESIPAGQRAKEEMKQIIVDTKLVGD